MKVIHVVPLVAQDGAYGGPLRVALNHVAELRRRGHSAELVSGWRGAGDRPSDIDGVPASLYRSLQVIPAGFSGVLSPGALLHLWSRRKSIDVVHIHSGRDLAGLTATALCLALRLPYFLQTHGMVVPDRRFKSLAFDFIFLRLALRRAKAVLALTQREHKDIARIEPRATVKMLPNGLKTEGPPATKSGVCNVLFCARLHERKRPMAFLQAASIVLARGYDANFSLVGPDEGELKSVLNFIGRSSQSDRIRYEGALSYGEVKARMSAADVYVLPSVNEPFPMSLLEALSLGIPSICTSTCGIAEELSKAAAVLVVSDSVEELADAMCSLLADDGARRAMGTRGWSTARDFYSIEAVVTKLLAFYNSLA